MSTAYQVGPSWLGFSGLDYLIIFGDSYSAVGYDHRYHPSASQPLGIPFPGATYNEPDLPNWVGYLITKYCPPPRFDPSEEVQCSHYTESPLLVYNYAKGGATILGVRSQIGSFSNPSSVKERLVPWKATDTLFTTWVGINDCAYNPDPNKAVQDLLSAQDELFKAGARNFLFIDVPPIHRSPAVPKQKELMLSTRFIDWNSALRAGIQQFCHTHPEASVFLFSSYRLFESILDMPELYGFNNEHVRNNGGGVWMDSLHPTSKVHDHIASNLADFLQEIVPLPVCQ